MGDEWVTELLERLGDKGLTELQELLAELEPDSTLERIALEVLVDTLEKEGPDALRDAVKLLVAQFDGDPTAPAITNLLVASDMLAAMQRSEGNDRERAAAYVELAAKQLGRIAAIVVKGAFGL